MYNGKNLNLTYHFKGVPLKSNHISEFCLTDSTDFIKCFFTCKHINNKTKKWKPKLNETNFFFIKKLIKQRDEGR